MGRAAGNKSINVENRKIKLSRAGGLSTVWYFGFALAVVNKELMDTVCMNDGDLSLSSVAAYLSNPMMQLDTKS